MKLIAWMDAERKRIMEQIERDEVPDSWWRCPNCDGIWPWVASCPTCENLGPLALATTEANELARKFHKVYEQVAVEQNYQTRKESRVPWRNVPDKNKRVMITTAARVLAWLREKNK